MQHPLDMGAAHYYPLEAQPDHRSHRYRSFMIEEILTDHPERKVSSPAGELLKFGVQALLSARPFHSHLVLKAEQASLLKFPMSPLSCSLGPLGSSPLLAGPPGLQIGPASHHLPLDLHLRKKRFEKQKYLSTPDRIDLAESLGLSQLQVKTWYQNRRMKWKKIVLQGGGLESPTKPKGRPKKNSIPSSEQLSEQERSRELDRQSDASSSHDLDIGQEDE
ncbi:hypothetical protein NHX12_029691 [Muraenolepis orangiensis]|uniref:Homeobox domain-containing protein n=1 Tax=Muraenolepis orangiensis TaxID=630683 RepID=A0A9Q0IL22_9TELE|nr:hypothetical protein NHX12_029691 [Muraenolepis orangiensis]